MKVYTSEVPQHGKTLNILNKKVTFDKTGCAEIEDEKFAKKLMNYSSWYSDKRPVLKEIKPKEFEIEDQLKSQELEAAMLEIEKLKKMNESRKEKVDKVRLESDDLRKELGKVVKERDEAKKALEDKEDTFNTIKEDLEYKFKLALLGLNELRATCKELEIKEGLYKKEQDKEKLIELIIKSAE